MKKEKPKPHSEARFASAAEATVAYVDWALNADARLASLCVLLQLDNEGAARVSMFTRARGREVLHAMRPDLVNPRLREVIETRPRSDRLLLIISQDEYARFCLVARSELKAWNAQRLAS